MLSDNAQALLSAMLNKKLFVALREPVDLHRMGELLEEHLRWAVEAERSGHLFASGPFVAPGQPPGAAGGMSILRTESLEQAQALLAQDPFVREGAVQVTWREWRLMEGGFKLTLCFSDQSLQVD